MLEKLIKFEEVYAINVNEFTEKKNGLTYLSWAHAVKEMTKAYPNWKYEVVKNENNIPAFGSPELGYMVYTRITVGEETKEMWLPVLDYKNQPIKNPNMFQINTSVMRCLTKNTAMFGLGLYIYAGEDLPEQDSQSEETLKAAFAPPMTQIDRATQEDMHKTAINLLQSCATLDRLAAVWKEQSPKWNKLDQDLFKDIEQKKNECKTDITRENNQRNEDLK